MFNLKQYNVTTAYLVEKGIDNPSVGIILGTGLGGLVNEIQIEIEIPYDEIPNFPIATVEFHKGKLIYGKLRGKQVLVMSGRFHYYEGYTMQEVTFPVRIMKLLGVKTLLLSNAAGGLNKSFQKSDLMLIQDHINLLPDNPLRGTNIDQFGPRFPDMSKAYSPNLNDQFKGIAEDLNIEIREGVYASVMGPNLETAAEYRFLGVIGADAVGMSTVPEVIVANHMGMQVAAISVITDLCDPENLAEVNIDEIIAAAGIGEKQMIRLFSELVNQLQG